MKVIFCADPLDRGACKLSEEKYGGNIVKQVVEPVNTTRKGRALFERSEFCSTLRSVYRL